MSATDSPLVIPFDPQELGGLVEVLRECPGRLSAAAVRSARVGDQLVERLRTLLDALELEEVGRRAVPDPVELGHVAEAKRQDVAVLVVRLDHHSMGGSLLEFFAGLNYQRERLAQGQLRTLLLMTHAQSREFGPGADDLWDWTLRFRFAATVSVASRTGVPDVRRERRHGGAEVSSKAIAAMADQLRRARAAGLNESVIVRDYALPYVEGLVANGRRSDAERVWEQEFREGEACDEQESSTRDRCILVGYELAIDRGRLADADMWSLRLLDTSTDDSSAVGRARAHDARGNYLMHTGDLKGARRHFERGLEVWERLAEEDPVDRERQRELSMSYEDLGDVAHEIGELEEARRCYERGLDTRERLVGVDPSNQTWQRDLAMSYEDLGHVAMDLGEYGEARTHYERARTVRERQAESNPASIRWQQDLADSYDDIGDVALELGALEEARDFYERALKIRERQAMADPSSARWQRDLAMSYDSVGNVVSGLGELGEAQGYYERALEVLVRRADADPSNVRWQRTLLATFIKVGDTARGLGDFANARKYYERALEVRERRADAGLSDARQQRSLSWSLWRLGQMTEPRSESLALLARALELVLGLARRTPTDRRTMRLLFRITSDVAQRVAVADDSASSTLTGLLRQAAEHTRAQRGLESISPKLQAWLDRFESD